MTPLVVTAPCRVGAEATHGAFWTLLFSVLSKAVALGSQLALAWLLLPEEFGLAAMTLSVMAFTAIVGAGNLKNILVQRPERFETEAGQVFWFAMALNGCAALVLAALAPMAGVLFNDSRVVPLILIAAVAQPCQALCTIHLAALHRAFHFKRIAMIQCAASILQCGGAVLLAWLGYGAFALVLPLIAVALWNVVALRLAAGKIPVGRPQPRQWRALGTPASWLMLNALFTSLLASGASFVIGLVQKDAALAGYYYWGFSLASQAVFLLVTNLQSVLFPVLNRLNGDTDRQFAAVEKCVRTLLTLIVPVCVLQCLLAGPFITRFFHHHWEPSITVVEWISVGLVGQPLYLVAVAVLMARGRFRRLAAVSGLAATATLLATAAGALLGDQARIAQFNALAILVANALAGWLAYREFGYGWKRLLGSIAPVLGIAALLAAAGWGMERVLTGTEATIRLCATVLVILTFYGVLVRYLFPQIAGDIIVRLSRRQKTNHLLPPEGDALEEVRP